MFEDNFKGTITCITYISYTISTNFNASNQHCCIIRSVI